MKDYVFEIVHVAFIYFYHIIIIVQTSTLKGDVVRCKSRLEEN